MFVTRSTGSFGAVDNSGSGGAEDLASGVAVAVYLEHPAEFVFGGHHPSPPLYFYKWGSSVPIHISLLLVLLWYWGLFALGSVALFLWGFQSSSRRDWPVLPQLEGIS